MTDVLDTCCIEILIECFQGHQGRFLMNKGSCLPFVTTTVNVRFTLLRFFLWYREKLKSLFSYEKKLGN
jgi:hypothetical protein